MEREGAAVTCDGRLLNCSTDERLQQETLCRRQWSDECVEHPETLMRLNVVVVAFNSRKSDGRNKQTIGGRGPKSLSRREVRGQTET